MYCVETSWPSVDGSSGPYLVPSSQIVSTRRLTFEVQHHSKCYSRFDFRYYISINRHAHIVCMTMANVANNSQMEVKNVYKDLLT